MSDTEQRVPTARCKVSGLWRSQTKNGVEYWSGKTEEGLRFTVYPNGFKTDDRHPDFVLYTEVPDSENKVAKNSRAIVAIADLQAPLKKA